MEKNSFIISTALVLIAQIPLLLKLYLDYRSKKDVFRQSLHERQMDIYEAIAAAMNELQSIQHGKVELFCEGVKDDDEFFKSIRNSEAEAWSKWSSLIKSKELFLRAELVNKISEYNTASARTLGVGISLIKTAEELKLNWKKQVELYNFISNHMRIMMGVDTLSQETLEMIQKEGKVKLVESDYKL